MSYRDWRLTCLAFGENVVVVANPAKDASSPWWYGTLAKGEGKGWFPHSYVEEMKGK
jgi:hypothetical protein